MFRPYIAFFFFTIIYPGISQQDSIIRRSLPRHYFPCTVLLDYYQKPEVRLPASSLVAEKLKSFQIRQSVLALSIPLISRDFLKKDSIRAHHSLLFTAHFLSFRPDFSGLSERHRLIKNGLGIRYFRYNGKKSIFFIDLAPFITMDKGYPETKIIRMASLFLWNYTVSPAFSFRLGFTKSFLWGNRYHLPYLGFRAGRIDKIHFNFQFPRSASLNVPLGYRAMISLFTRPQGGLFTLSNKDTLYAAFLSLNRKVFLGRYELLSGLRIDIMPWKGFSFYLSAGTSAVNFLALYSLQYNRGTRFEYAPFYSYQEQDRTAFINGGMFFFFGKTRSAFQQQAIEEMKQLNNQTGSGDNNLSVFQGNPSSGKIRKKDLPEKEMADLLNQFDY